VWSGRLAIAGSPTSKAYPGIPVTGPNGVLHVPYLENTCGNYRVFYRARRPDGSWTLPELPIPACEFQTGPQAIVSADGRAQLVLTRGTDITFASREASGWASLNVSASPNTNSHVPTAARMFGTHVFVAWDEGVNSHDVQARISPDSGKTWGPLLSISSSPQYATAPTAEWLFGTTRVGISWIDSTGSLDDQPDVFYAEIDVLSRAMTPPVRLGQLPGAAARPSLAALGPASLVWQDKTSGDWQIFVTVDPGAWHARARLVCLNGQAPTVAPSAYRFFWSVWPPNPLVWHGAPADQLLRLSTAQTATTSSFYLGLENAAGTEVLGPVLGAPHPLMLNSTFFNPPTLMLRWSVADVPKSLYTFSFYAPPASCPGQAPLSALTPRAGEVIPLWQGYNVRWLAGSEVRQVRIEFSSNNGATWQLVRDLAPNNGLSQWTPFTATSQGRIRVTSTTNPAISAVTGTFTVR
jgi:hypothetical protein